MMHGEIFRLQEIPDHEHIPIEMSLTAKHLQNNSNVTTP